MKCKQEAGGRRQEAGASFIPEEQEAPLEAVEQRLPDELLKALGIQLPPHLQCA